MAFKSNIKFAFEGEEEAGSPNLEKTLAANKELFAADLWLMCDGPRLSDAAAVDHLRRARRDAASTSRSTARDRAAQRPLRQLGAESGACRSRGCWRR